MLNARRRRRRPLFREAVEEELRRGGVCLLSSGSRGSVSEGSPGLSSFSAEEELREGVFGSFSSQLGRRSLRRLPRVDFGVSEVVAQTCLVGPVYLGDILSVLPRAKTRGRRRPTPRGVWSCVGSFQEAAFPSRPCGACTGTRVRWNPPDPFSRTP